MFGKKVEGIYVALAWGARAEAKQGEKSRDQWQKHECNEWRAERRKDDLQGPLCRLSLFKVGREKENRTTVEGPRRSSTRRNYETQARLTLLVNFKKQPVLIERAHRWPNLKNICREPASANQGSEFA
jgi:hypothetical protein